MKKLLQIQDLNIGYKKALTNKIDLEAGENDFICIIGRNGTGKSTLLNTIAGVIKPISGKCYIAGNEISQIKNIQISQIVSYVPSKQEYLSNLKVIELVSLGRSPYTNIFDKKTEKDNKIISNYLDELEITHLAEKNLYSISDGERQRAMICRAFVQETPIILLDEPTSFLDYYSKNKLLQKLSELATKNDKCIIFSSHDLEIAFKHVTKIWLFNENMVDEYNLNELKQSKLLENLMSFKIS
ncbi:MAG: ABC transporter ATP-binding protein [Bacteroidales bacterium]|nr:ABC transporter ATP-binding protein [Bacteroidales bacterium]